MITRILRWRMCVLHLLALAAGTCILYRLLQEDIPALVAEAQQQHPHLHCVVSEPIGKAQ